MLFLDQRGTGLSSPISAATLSREGTPKQQAQYLKLFRADSIIRDCEAVRKCLTKDYPEKKQKWSVLGQSFGGFCAVTYLSQFPEGLKEVFTCGGLPPLINTPDQAYTQTYKKVVQRNEAYYTKYAEDVPRVHQICKYLDSSSPLLPSQIPLTSRRFLQIGLAFGFHGGFESVHDVILKAATELDTIGMMTRSTLASIDSNLDFDQNVLYAILHEPIYCQGAASNWSAHRVKKHFPQFESFGENTNYSLDNPIYFAGEMIYPWMFTDYAELQALQPVAEILAAVDDWPTLYDTEQLAKNEVPVYSATYMEDMYVDFGFARNTASKIRGCKEFITNVLYHNALGSKSDEVMKQLFAMRDDVVD
ncbi:MAG: hypothetical protein M4579_001437 [Chaenotheca gracillima]|nr:MAG: hypothetical protein M4579_001437 [Chaenotheca gracillima]